MSEREGPGRPVGDENKGASGADGVIARTLNRPPSRAISARVAGLPLTADHWSYTAFGLVCAGAAAWALRSPRIAAALVHAGSVIDGVDGEVARLQGTSSRAGGLLDLGLDWISDTALLAGLATAAGGRRLDWLLALTAANGIGTASVLKERANAEGVTSSDLQQREAASGDWIAALMPLGGRDERLFAAAAAGLLGRPRLALGYLAITTSLRLGRRLATALAALRAAEASERPVGGRATAPAGA